MRAHKFTDREVREHSTLLNLATNYAAGYEGDFEFMRDAKALALARNTLPTQVARGVLNCMLADPRVTIFDRDDQTVMQIAPRPVSDYGTNVFDIKTKEPKSVKPTYHPYRIFKSATIKQPFFTARNAEVFHRVTAARIAWDIDKAAYKRINVWGDVTTDKPAIRKPNLQVETKCKSGRRYAQWYEKGHLHNKVSKGDRLCRGGCWTVYCESCDKETKPNDITDITYDGRIPCGCCGTMLQLK